MATSVQVEAARIPDRDQLLKMLVDEGLPAEPVGEIEIQVPCEGVAADVACDDVLAHVESVIFDLGAPFVPIKHDGVVYVRPPVN